MGLKCKMCGRECVLKDKPDWTPEQVKQMRDYGLPVSHGYAWICPERIGKPGVKCREEQRLGANTKR